MAIVDAQQFWGNLDNNELRQRLGMQQFSKYRHYYRPEYTPLMACSIRAAIVGATI
jgi:hypothetical protein